MQPRLHLPLGVMVIDGVSGGLASELELKLQDTKNGFITKLLGNGQIRPPKFDTWCRVTNIFRSNNKGWMAMLLWRRALLVFCFTASFASCEGPYTGIDLYGCCVV